MASEAKFLSKLSQFLLTIKNRTKVLLHPQQTQTSSSTLSPYLLDEETLERWRTVCFSDIIENVENDPIVIQALLFSHYILQDLILGQFVPQEVTDHENAYTTLKYNVMEFRNTVSEALLKSLEELDLTSHEQFEAVANELFELNTDESRNPKMTWGRMVTLFSFAVCLAQKYKQKEDKIEEVSRYLAKYILKYGLPFIRSSGGWGDIVNELPAEKESTITRNSGEIIKDFGLQEMVLWSGLCIGSVATTMFVLCRK